jgi:hypothetical protein
MLNESIHRHETCRAFRGPEIVYDENRPRSEAADRQARR